MIPKFSDAINTIMKVSIILPFAIIGVPAVTLSIVILLGLLYKHLITKKNSSEAYRKKIDKTFRKDLKDAFMPIYFFLLSATHTVEFFAHQNEDKEFVYNEAVYENRWQNQWIEHMEKYKRNHEPSTTVNVKLTNVATAPKDWSLTPTMTIENDIEMT